MCEEWLHSHRTRLRYACTHVVSHGEVVVNEGTSPTTKPCEPSHAQPPPPPTQKSRQPARREAVWQFVVLSVECTCAPK